MADSETNAPKLVSQLLNGQNYLSWARAVTLALSGKGKLGHITGTAKKPEEDATETKQEEWQATDHLVMSWIINSMTSKIGAIFLYKNSAKELWDAAQSIYGKTNNFAHIFKLKHDLSQTKQQGQTITEYLGTLQRGWDELAIYEPTTTDPRVLLERKERDQIYQFLIGLDGSYEAIRSQVLMTPTVPDLASIIAMIQQEESRRTTAQIADRPSETQAFFAGKPQNQTKKYGNKPQETCDNCKKTGHNRNSCWFLHPHLRPTREGGDHRNKKRNGGPKGNGAVANPNMEE